MKKTCEIHGEITATGRGTCERCEQKTCVQCGARMNSGSIYCTNCGSGQTVVAENANSVRIDAESRHVNSPVTQAAKAATDAMYADAPDANTAGITEAEEVPQFKVLHDERGGVCSIVLAEHGEKRTWKDGTVYTYEPPAVCRIVVNCKRSWPQTVREAERICFLLNEYGM